MGYPTSHNSDKIKIEEANFLPFRLSNEQKKTCFEHLQLLFNRTMKSHSQYFFTKDGGLRFIFALVTITVFKTKSESAWTTTNAYRRGTENKSPG